MQYDDVITNSRWRTDAILKILFWLYLGAILAELSDFDQIWYADANFHFEDGYMDKSRNFEHSRWRLKQEMSRVKKIATATEMSHAEHAPKYESSPYNADKCDSCESFTVCVGG